MAGKADKADTEVGADVHKAVVQVVVRAAAVQEVVQAVAVVHTVLMVLDYLDYPEHLGT